MRTLFTALAFVVIFLAVMPAVKRSILPRHRDTDTTQDDAS